MKRLALFALAAGLLGNAGCLGTMHAIGPFSNELASVTGVEAEPGPLATQGGLVFGSRASSHVPEDLTPGKPPEPVDPADISEENAWDAARSFQRELDFARPKAGKKD